MTMTMMNDLIIRTKCQTICLQLRLLQAHQFSNKTFPCCSQRFCYRCMDPLNCLQLYAFLETEKVFHSFQDIPADDLLQAISGSHPYFTELMFDILDPNEIWGHAHLNSVQSQHEQQQATKALIACIYIAKTYT